MIGESISRPVLQVAVKAMSLDDVDRRVIVDACVGGVGGVGGADAGEVLSIRRGVVVCCRCGRRYK